MKMNTFYPKAQAFLAALLFGASAPLSKLLLADIQPIPLAAFLYLGSGFGLLLYLSVTRLLHGHTESEPGLRWRDSGWLAGAVLAGGVAAPIALLFSLRITPASTSSMLLNFEGVSTALIAAMVFREAIGRSIWIAISIITVACGLLTWVPNGEWGFSIGAVGVLLACIFWGIDNNLTSRLSSKDPLVLVTIKGMGAGSFSLLLAVLTGSAFPHIAPILLSMLLGFFSYGMSIVLFIFSMRRLGAARASAIFSVAPFVGTFLSFLLFREAPGIVFFVALILMVIGVLLILGENHGHLHSHAVLTHEHRHSHDDGHHAHLHSEGDLLEHSHDHRHEAEEHVHPHTPDLHHRHPH